MVKVCFFILFFPFFGFGFYPLCVLEQISGDLGSHFWAISMSFELNLIWVSFLFFSFGLRSRRSWLSGTIGRRSLMMWRSGRKTWTSWWWTSSSPRAMLTPLRSSGWSRGLNVSQSYQFLRNSSWVFLDSRCGGIVSYSNCVCPYWLQQILILRRSPTAWLLRKRCSVGMLRMRLRKSTTWIPK